MLRKNRPMAQPPIHSTNLGLKPTVSLYRAQKQAPGNIGERAESRRRLVSKRSGINWQAVVQKGKWRPVAGRVRNPAVCSVCGFEGTGGKMANMMLKLHVRQYHPMFKDNWEQMIKDNKMKIEEEEEVAEEMEETDNVLEKGKESEDDAGATPSIKTHSQRRKVPIYKEPSTPALDKYPVTGDDYDYSIIDTFIGVQGFSKVDADITKQEVSRGTSENNTFNNIMRSRDNVYHLHSCQLCPHKVSHLAGIKRHLNKKHLKLLKPFTCSVCQTRFQDPRMVNMHVQLHHSSYDANKEETSEPAVLAPADETSTVETKEALEDKEGELMKCEECEYKTSNKGHIKIHMIELHGKGNPWNTWSCEQCTFRTTTRGRLLNHKKEIHNDSLQMGNSCQKDESKVVSDESESKQPKVERSNEGVTEFRCI